MSGKIDLIRPLTRNRLHEEIEAILLKNIIGGELSPGDKLPTEREFARSFDVNRSTVREALGKLESLDLVEIRHGDGAYVKDYLESGNLELISAMIALEGTVSPEILSSVLEVRRIVAPEMAFSAALKRSDEHVRLLEEIVVADLAVAEADIMVHHLIARASNNVLYLLILNFFNKFMRELGHLYFDAAENEAVSRRFHADILEAIRERRPEEARKVMRDVLVYAEDAINDRITA